MKYKVWTARPRYFATLEAACAFADEYFFASGEIVAVTAYRPRNRKDV